MAFFARSRTRKIEVAGASVRVPTGIQNVAEREGENKFWTLGPGKKSKPFWAIIGSSQVTVLTGGKKTPKTLQLGEIEACLNHFRSNSFPLSNSKTAADRNPAGLGAYFARHFGSSVFASHFAALWVHQGRLEANRESMEWWFRAKIPGS